VLSVCLSSAHPLDFAVSVIIISTFVVVVVVVVVVEIAAAAVAVNSIFMLK